jgi:hypothetical protein
VAQRGRDLLLPTHPAPPETGVFHSIVDLQAAINRYVEETNAEPKPFVWTADPDVVLGKVNRGTQALASVH